MQNWPPFDISSLCGSKLMKEAGGWQLISQFNSTSFSFLIGWWRILLFGTTLSFILGDAEVVAALYGAILEDDIVLYI